MTNFSLNSKIPIFGPFPQFLGQNVFQKKSGCHAQLHQGFWHHAKIQRNLMILFPEYTQTDARTGWPDPIS